MYLKQSGWHWSDHCITNFKVTFGVDSAVLHVATPQPLYLWNSESSYPVIDSILHSSVSKESACDAGDLGLIPGLGRSPGEGNGNPLQYSCLENPMDRGAWQVTVHGVARVRCDLATTPPPPDWQWGVDSLEHKSTFIPELPTSSVKLSFFFPSTCLSILAFKGRAAESELGNASLREWPITNTERKK